MKAVRVSVALATYNGAEYIEEQLQSIFDQTRRPDEVIICDDQSTDCTFDIILKFIMTHDLNDTWKAAVNDKRLGCDSNFVLCAEKASGDIVFFSDQDDIWDAVKIERMLQVFGLHPKALAVTCNSRHVDSTGACIKKLSTGFTTKSGENIVQYGMKEQIYYNRSAGLEIAFKRDIIDDLKGMVETFSVTHDQPVGMIACLKGEYYGINEELLSHRIHGYNLSAPRTTIRGRISSVKDQIAGNKEHLKHLAAFRDYYEGKLSIEDRAVINYAITCTEDSIDALEGRKFLKGLKLVLSHNEVMNKWIRINNLLCILFGNYKDVYNG